MIDALSIKVFHYKNYNIALYHILLFIWLLVSVTKIILFITRYVKFYCIANKLASNSNNDLQELADNIASKLKIKTKFRICISSHFHIPMIIGYFHPLIFLPDIPFTNNDLKYILTHEMQHYKNRDIWLKLITNLLCYLYWWNPFMYLLRYDLDYLLEINCDDNVCYNLNPKERIQYLETILKIMKQSKNSKYNLDFSMSLFPNQTNKTYERFQLVLNYQKAKKNSLKIFLPFVLITFLLSYLFVLQPYYEPDTPDILTEKNSYILKEDNRYSLYMNNEYVTDLDSDIINELNDSGIPVIIQEGD